MITQKPCKIGYKLVLFIDRLLISTKIGVLKWRWTALWPSLFVFTQNGGFWSQLRQIHWS